MVLLLNHLAILTELPSEWGRTLLERLINQDWASSKPFCAQGR